MMKSAAILLLVLAGVLLTPANAIVDDGRGSLSEEKHRLANKDGSWLPSSPLQSRVDEVSADPSDHNSLRNRELQEQLQYDVASTLFTLTSGQQQDFTYTAISTSGIYWMVTCRDKFGDIQRSNAGSIFDCGATYGPTTSLTIGTTYTFSILADASTSAYINDATVTISINDPISTSFTPTPTSITTTPATPAPVSISSPAPTCSCFSESTTVQVLDEEAPVEMKELKVGQQIFAGMNENSGKPHYETVYGFAHRDEDQQTDYLRITTSSSSNKKATSSTLEITSNHLIFLQDKKDPVPAGSLQVGDVLIRQSINQKEAESATITGIKVIRQRGLYAPLTKDGTVIVDGFHASAYVSIQQSVPRVIGATTKVMSEQSFFHWWMAPYRVFCTRVAPKLCMDDYNEEEGYINWLVLGKGLADIAQESSNLIMVVGLAVVFSFCGAFMLLESLMEKAIFWFLLIVGGGFLWWQRLPSHAEKQHKKVP